MALKVLDRAMQAFGAEGICQDQPLAQMFAGLRTLRYADVSFDSLRPPIVALELQLTLFDFYDLGSRRGTHAPDREGRVETSAYAGRTEQADQGQARSVGRQGQSSGQVVGDVTCVVTTV